MAKTALTCCENGWRTAVLGVGVYPCPECRPDAHARWTTGRFGRKTKRGRRGKPAVAPPEMDTTWRGRRDLA